MGAKIGCDIVVYYDYDLCATIDGDIVRAEVETDEDIVREEIKTGKLDPEEEEEDKEEAKKEKTEEKTAVPIPNVSEALETASKNPGHKLRTLKNI
jgi:hypothetical protein